MHLNDTRPDRDIVKCCEFSVTAAKTGSAEKGALSGDLCQEKKNGKRNVKEKLLKQESSVGGGG